MITQIAIINKLKKDLIRLEEADYAFEVEICETGIDSVADDTWARGAGISRAIISTRMQISKLKREAGGFGV
jgi:hypothetical protein